MGRNRVLSFMSQFSSSHRDSTNSSTPTSSSSNDDRISQIKADSGRGSRRRSSSQPTYAFFGSRREPAPDAPVLSSPIHGQYAASPISIKDSPPTSPAGHRRTSSRPLSMIQTYQPPVMDVNEETPPELQPVFTFLNSHQNKLYQEGYFLKLDDQDSKGKPNPDRTWTECFAQLVGTVLSLWDAAELDAAGEDGEVLPKFINLTDASIKMIESLPTRTNDEQPLQNILSISTAGRNRYLLHFNSHHSLIQWTAGIRLAMYEHATLQEAYTGALIAGKGKTLNNINIVMERTRVKVEEWVRVRFGAGVPWRRCWCVIQPPDEKEYQKMQRDLKKRSPYDRSHPPMLKGEIKFYDSKKDAEKKKKSKPIATITDSYSAYALYPQAKALIDGSTLLKIEGQITIHSEPPSSTEGFVFIMPETHPMVSGFEMLLRFLFPTWDTFGLYGRPGRLVASHLDPRSLMFAMPKHKRYGYLEILDVSTLIMTEGSSTWTECEWRKKLKEVTGQRMSAVEDDSKTPGRSSSRNSKRLSLGPPNAAPSRPRVGFADDAGSSRSSRSMSLSRPGPRTDSAPPDTERERLPPSGMNVHFGHARNISDSELENALPHPEPGRAAGAPPALRIPTKKPSFGPDPASERAGPHDEMMLQSPSFGNMEGMQRMQTPEPVNAPPAFSHSAHAKPQAKPLPSPEMRRATSRLSITTLSQLATAGGLTPEQFRDDPISGRQSSEDGADSSFGQIDPRGPAVQPQANTNANAVMMNANFNGSREAVTPPPNPNPLRSFPGLQAPNMTPAQTRPRSPMAGPPTERPTGPPGGFARTDSPSGFRSTPPPPIFSPPNNRGPPPPMMSPRGPPPNGRGFPPSDRDPRMGPPPPAGPPPNGGFRPYSPAPRGPPQGSRGTPPPNMPPNMQRPPGAQPFPYNNNMRPLPQRTTSLQNKSDQSDSGSVPQSPVSSTGSFAQHVVDESALARVLMAANDDSQSESSRGFQHNGGRGPTSQPYDDTSSVASPDYASTYSSEPRESVERPRAGVLKTVGDSTTSVEDSPKAKPGVVDSGYDVPDVDFGPTFNYGAAAVPRRKTPIPFGRDSPGSSGNQTQRSYSPATAAAAAAVTAAGAAGRKSPGPNAGFSAHGRQDSDDTIRRRSVAWQPGGGAARSPSPSAEQALSPEQFVQQRAAAALASPVYTHQRNPSGNTLATLRMGTPTPPPFHSRNSSADLLQGGRPLSQGTGIALTSAEMSSHLSAREQEYVARVTGSPLVGLAGNNNNKAPGQPQNGLVGAIDARERERAQMKQGYSGQAVAQAIDQRQREQHQQAQRAAQAAFAQQQAQQQAQQHAQMAAQQSFIAGPIGGPMGGPMGGPNSNMMGQGAPSAYAPSMMSMPIRSMSPAPLRSMSPAPLRSMSPAPMRAMSPGPGVMMGQAMSPPSRQGPMYQPPPGMGPPQPRPQMMSPQGSFNNGMPQNFGPPGTPIYMQGGGFSRPNIQNRPPPLQPSSMQPPVPLGMQSTQPRSPGFQLPPQGQYGGTPAGPRPGTPGRMQFQGQAF